MKNQKEIKIIVPPKVEEQIQYVCRHFPNQEWSGVVFYTTTGSIKNVDTFKITLKDLFPMNIGEAAYTESDFDGKIIDFQIKNGYELLPYAIIHSHNHMGAFFSGTDMNELKENAHCHNLYVSIVVNNIGQIVAKAAQQLYIKPYSLFYKDETGKAITVNTEVSTKTLIAFYDGEIIRKTTLSTAFQGLSEICANLKPSLALSKKGLKQKKSLGGLADYHYPISRIDQEIDTPAYNWTRNECD